LLGDGCERGCHMRLSSKIPAAVDVQSS